MLKKNIYDEALKFHKEGRGGKVGLELTKPLKTQYDLSLAYSPGVAAPCLEISKDIDKAYDYTSKGNTVAVISNGTAVLGLGNLGALASKPVMEGKAALFKRFADIDAVDIEVSTEDIDEFINVVKYIADSWGGINLEDIKAPGCFVIEEKLKELLSIPVFHDDQHGTAVITLAALINALELTGRGWDNLKIAVSGAGAAATACVDLIKSVSGKNNQIIVCDTKGVIYKGRKEGMNPWKEKYAVDTDDRTLEDAMKNADVLIGVSAKGAVLSHMVKKMADRPIIFAMANPDPEITPEDAKAACSDVIIATGRSDYPNQVNNVMGFPYIFRGALDVRASSINQEMKIAASNALAMLAREKIPSEVSDAYDGKKMEYGPDHIIPSPFDPRLIYILPVAVAKAAIDTGVAGVKDFDLEQYTEKLKKQAAKLAKQFS